MIERSEKSIGYVAINDGETLIASQAMAEIGHEGYCKVISHKVRAEVSYLVELPNGERKWFKKP